MPLCDEHGCNACDSYSYTLKKLFWNTCSRQSKGQHAMEGRSDTPFHHLKTILLAPVTVISCNYASNVSTYLQPPLPCVTLLLSDCLSSGKRQIYSMQKYATYLMKSRGVTAFSRSMSSVKKKCKVYTDQQYTCRCESWHCSAYHESLL